MKHFLLLILACVFLSACTEMEYASHLTKSAMGPSPYVHSGKYPKLPEGKSQEGMYKVGNPYKIEGQWYYPKETYSHTETGIASWYGPGFEGKKTANGEVFHSYELTAAHRTLQMPSMVRVTNLDNGKSIIVRVNDRGPYSRGRVIDLSKRAAELLDFKNAGTAKVRIELMPEESYMLANMAKVGESTRGTELAANRGELVVPAHQRAATPVRTASVGDTPMHLNTEGVPTPDPVVTQLPVTKTGIFVQAGSFTVRENAEALRATLSSVGQVEVHPTTIRGQQFFRVRVGPVANVPAADRVLSQVVNLGHPKATIVVE